MKRFLKIFAGFFLLLILIVFVLRFLVGRGEDTWICKDGEWVKHGMPSAPKPGSGCGKDKREAREEGRDEGLKQRLKTLRDHLHGENSGTEARQLFKDLMPVYTDDGHGNPQIPVQILPFTYYHSKEGDITVSICNINRTVFICPGKLERLITPSDYKNCQVAAEYLQIER